MGLHRHILHDSPLLQEAIDQFAKQCRMADRLTPDLREMMLLRLDAPRALSDAFLACAAAVLVDSDWRTFNKELRPVFDLLLDRPADLCWPSKVDPIVSALRLV